MRKKINKEIVWILYLMTIWILPVFDMYISVDIFVFWGVFLLSVVLNKIINKRILSDGLILLLTVIVCIYKANYLITALPVLLLIISHTQALTKDKATETDNVCETLSLLLLIGNLIFSGIMLSEREIKVYLHLKAAFECLSWIIVMFVVLFIVALRKETTRKVHVKNTTKNKLQFIYIVALFGLLVTGFSYFALNGQGNVKAVNAEFFYWYIFVLTVISNDDPYVNAVVEKVEAFLKKALSD